MFLVIALDEARLVERELVALRKMLAHFAHERVVIQVHCKAERRLRCGARGPGALSHVRARRRERAPRSARTAPARP